ncbi:hypothetical protein KQY30_05720 [Streptomyces sp. GMY02]|uniref:hypothetical protein n=1 Tax=Streptomyces sp. GMY02 TaxID=1333528 RepID=UPI001C2BD63C|nr:hypothetical protein [Streptomyces sp. GMY02]QXE33866.1 hypothetical protein KQY30_05720 [Streptomyces sp. GMY02]
MMTKAEMNRSGIRPREVDAAFLLLLVVIALNPVSWVLDTFVISPSGFDEMRGEMGEDGAIRQTALSAGFMVVSTALLLLFALSMRRGRTWARNAITAVGAVLLFVLVNSVSSDEYQPEATAGGVYDLVIGVSPVVLIAGAVVLVFLPTARTYFSITHSE